MIHFVNHEREENPERSHLKSFHESLGAGLGDGSEIVDEVGLGHSDSRVDESEGLVVLVGDDLDEEVLPGLQLGGVGEGLVSDLVQGVAGIADHFSDEDLLVGVESVDDQRHQLCDLRLEDEGLRLLRSPSLLHLGLCFRHPKIYKNVRQGRSQGGAQGGASPPPPPEILRNTIFLKFIDQKHEEMHTYQG